MFNFTSNYTLQNVGSDYLQLVLTWTVGLMSLIAIISNTLVITTILGNKTLRTMASAFLFNLAMSDLIISLLMMPILVSDLKNGQWMMSQVRYSYFVLSLSASFCS